jgi:hypothetical protein
MTRRIQMVLVIFCVLALTAGSVLAQRSNGPERGFGSREATASKRVLTPGKAQTQMRPLEDRGSGVAVHPPAGLLTSPPAGAPSIDTFLGYQASLQASVYYPVGVGVSYKGERIYLTEDYEDYVYYLMNGSLKTYGYVGYELHALRNRGSLYAGTAYGDLYKISPGGDVQLIGWDHYGDDVAALDVDAATGAVYFIANFDYAWTGLYKLPAGASAKEAILLAWWLDYPCWGIAVKGNKIFTTDYYDGSVYTCDKNGDHWEKVLWGFNGPTDLGFDKLGNLFVAEWDGGSIARVRAGSTKVARIAEGLSRPYYLEVDGLNRVTLTDYYGWAVWRLWK